MKQLILTSIFIVIGIAQSVFSQVPRFQKYLIANSEAHIYMPQEPTWDISISEDSSTIYMADVEVDSVDYGAIVVKFNQNLGEDKEYWQMIMTSYLEFLSENVFQLKEMMPPGYGHTLESNSEAIGLITYGIDYDGYTFNIKAWIDSEYLAILMVVSEDEVNFNVQELFLNGFRFPVR